MPTGRPSKIDQVVRTRTVEGPNGPTEQRLTVADVVLEAMVSTPYLETAAQRAGVTKQTLHSWLRQGADARAQQAGGTKLTAAQRKVLAFLDSVELVEAEWEVRQNTLLEQLARGRDRTIITEKHDAEGNMVERTERTEQVLPDADVITWRLTRKFPKRYGNQVQITGADGGPLEVQATLDTLAERLRRAALEPEAEAEDQADHG